MHKDFYCDVLGLENGERPPLGFPATGSIKKLLFGTDAHH